MKDLDKVIAGLERCGVAGGCIGCEYNDYSGGFDKCMSDLMRDALEYLKRMDDLRKDMWDRTNENHRLKRELKAAREKLSWLEEMLPTMPNDWGEYPPEFPREGM